MSTRCQIAFYEDEAKDLNGFTALIYRHMDGYPEGMLPDLLPILKDFDKNRGLEDIEYASAWVVAKLKNDYLNIGICKNFHGDIEYLYAVTSTKLDIFEVGFDFGNEASDINKRVKKIKTIDLKEV